MNLIETSSTRAYWNDLKYAHKLKGNERISVFVGRAGVGKTTIARKFAEQNSDCTYVYAPPRVTKEYSTRRLMQAVCEAIGMENTPYRVIDMVWRMIEMYRNHGHSIIIDNANSITSYLCFDPLKFVHDNSQIRWILIGTIRLRQWLSRAENEEFSSRVRWFREVAPVTVKDLEKAFPRYSTEVLQKLHQITGGIMRDIVAHVADLDGAAAIEPEDVTVKLIDSLARNAWRKVA